MAGENDIDFSFEELEFITGDLGDLEGTEEGTEGNPNETVETEEEIAAKLAAEKEKKEKGVSTPEEEAARLAAEKEVAEGVNPEGVGDGSTDGDKGDGKGTSPQLYQTLATVLKEQGVFSSVEDSSLEKVKDVDGLIEIIKSQIEAEEYKDLTDVYGREFLSHTFKIPEDKIEAFIAYVETNNFDYELLKDDNEIKLIEHLYAQSQQFLKSENDKD